MTACANNAYHDDGRHVTHTAAFVAATVVCISSSTSLRNKFVNWFTTDVVLLRYVIRDGFCLTSRTHYIAE
eukprot:scaffold596064_cov18-Prasinocladus_malaysianus.AAC.1